MAQISLLNVAFWKQKGDLTASFWEGCLDDGDLVKWDGNGRDPGVLAAIQWCRMVAITCDKVKNMPASDYHEVRYEEFMKNTHDVLSRL